MKQLLLPTYMMAVALCSGCSNEADVLIVVNSSIDNEIVLTPVECPGYTTPTVNGALIITEEQPLKYCESDQLKNTKVFDIKGVIIRGRHYSASSINISYDANGRITLKGR